MSYTITIPESLYSKAQRIADSNSQSVDDVIRQLLSESLDNPRLALPKAEQDELNALVYLTDAPLWTIAREQMPQNQQDRMHVLMDKNTMGQLTDTEQIELTNLVEDGQRLMLRKAEAARLLMQRGYTISLDSLAADNGE